MTFISAEPRAKLVPVTKKGKRRTTGCLDITCILSFVDEASTADNGATIVLLALNTKA